MGWYEQQSAPSPPPFLQTCMLKNETFKEAHNNLKIAKGHIFYYFILALFSCFLTTESYIPYRNYYIPSKFFSAPILFRKTLVLESILPGLRKRFIFNFFLTTATIFWVPRVVVVNKFDCMCCMLGLNLLK